MLHWANLNFSLRPPEGVTRPTAAREVGKSAERAAESSGEIDVRWAPATFIAVIITLIKSALPLFSPGLAQNEEPLFMKLCSPAHRRTAALAVLSAQSSMDESSSSLASRSRSVSPLRSKQKDALLIDLSTGMFDTNNPKVIKCGFRLKNIKQQRGLCDILLAFGMTGCFHPCSSARWDEEACEVLWMGLHCSILMRGAERSQRY